MTRDERLLAVSVQGIVNGKKPRVYLLFDHYDHEWLEWLRTNDLTDEPESADSLEELVSRFRDDLQGAVVTTERWINIACMAAAARDLAIVTPELLDRCGLPVVLDLRKCGWDRDLDGYLWAKVELWPHLSRRMLGHLSPHSSHMQRDLLIAQKAFLFWVPGAHDGGDEGADPLQSLLFARQLLAETPPLTSVCGWWGWGDPYEGIGEYWGMTLASRFGKLTPGTEFASNLSLHSAIRVPESLLRRRTPRRQRPDLQRDRAYVALSVLDSGDAVWYCQRRQREVWADKARGGVPIGWSFTPSLLDFAPAMAAYYQQRATDHDELMAAASGLMYCSLREYGTAFADPQRVRRQYFETTWRYMQRLGMDTMIGYIDHWGASTDLGDGGIMTECARAMPGVRALFPDLGRVDSVSHENANYVLAEGVPVFHCLTRYRPWSLATDVAKRDVAPEAAWLLDELRDQVPPARPCFVSAFPLSWTMTPSAIQEVVRALPEDHRAVLPGELGDLFARCRRMAEAGAPRPIIPGTGMVHSLSSSLPVSCRSGRRPGVSRGARRSRALADRVG